MTLPRDELREALATLEREIGAWEFDGPNGPTTVTDFIAAALSSPPEARKVVCAACNDTGHRYESRALRYVDCECAAPSLPASPPDGTVGDFLAQLPDAETCTHIALGFATKADMLREHRDVAATALRLAAHLRSQAGMVGAEGALTREEHHAFNALIDFAMASFDALDNSEDRGVKDEEGCAEVVIFDPWHQQMQDACEKLTDLPDDQPGYVMGPIAKVQWALRRWFRVAPPALAAAPARGSGE